MGVLSVLNLRDSERLSNVLSAIANQTSSQLKLRVFYFSIDFWNPFHYNRDTEKEAEMKYIDFAENERLSTIVLGMMRISELSEDEVEALVEAALSIGINTFDLADI